MLKFAEKNWWKVLTAILLFYVLIAGFLFPVPDLSPNLHQSIRNLYFHVPMWFGMVIILTISAIYSIKYLRGNKPENDIIAVEMANIGILFGVLGLLTGMVWAFVTWGDWWSKDPKQNTSAVALLIYLAYFVLRNSIDDLDKRGKISAVYNIFAYAVMIPLIYILPRMTDSLHPGNGGNPGFNVYDLAKQLRPVFYPAVFAFTLLGIWIALIRVRLKIIENKQLEIEND